MSVAPLSGGLVGVPGFVGQSVSQVLASKSMYPVSLGSVTFITDECPEKWNVGASEQMLVVHDLIGGGRIVQDMGNKPAEVSWTGRFFGNQIPDRVQQLRLYQINEQEVLLSWWFEQYYVRIKSFDPGYMGGYNEYSITLVITRDNNGAFTLSNAPSIDQQVSALQSQAVVANQAILNIDPTGAQAFQSQLAAVAAAIAAALPLLLNAASSANVIGNAISAALVGIGTYQNAIGESATQYPSTVMLAAALSLINASVLQGQSLSAVEAVGGDLFGSAVLAYGDISQCVALANANGYVSPLLPTAAGLPILTPALAPAA